MAPMYAESTILNLAEQIIVALKTKDGKALAKLAHPDKGVRFSPYAYVDVDVDRVFSPAEIASFWEDRRSYFWGFADGTGDPINMTPNQYYDRFIMDRDFANATSISINNDRASGNTINNAAAVYPETTRVEFYVVPQVGEGTPEFDWAALRLVFERSADSWYLIALIHDEWTI